jgi:hypothetical protein
LRVLYSLLKLKLEYIDNQKYNLYLDNKLKEQYSVLLCDNQLFRLIRIIQNKDADSKKIIELTNEKKAINRSESPHKYKFINEQLKKEQFMNEIVFVEIPSYGDRKEINKCISRMYKKGIYINDQKFIRWGKSASMTRHSIIALVREDIYDRLYQMAMMDIKLDDVIIAKWEAYFNLLLSSCEFVNILPNIVVIPDYYVKLPPKKVQFVVEKNIINKETGKPIKKDNKDENITYKDIELIEKDDIENNAFDGCGMCMPYVSQQFSEDLGLDYKPCAWVIRLPFVKGLVVEMDFYEYAKENGLNVIKDYWGKEHNIWKEKIDIVITESMFKGIKYFKSWDEYIVKFNKYQHKMGITRYNKNPKKELNMTRYNFQYLQALNLGDKIKDLADYSIEWVNKIITGNKLYTLLFLGTLLKEDSNVDADDDYVEYDESNLKEEVEELIDGSNKYIQAILLNDKMLKDVHIQNEFLYNMIKKYIREMKFGKIWVSGKYEFIYPDMFAFMQHTFGQQVTGLLKEGEHWSYGKLGKATGTRSPLIHCSEVNRLNYINNEMTDKWFSHLYHGIMLNIFGLDTMRMSDCDYDGDIIMSTDNPLIYDSIIENYPITMNKPKAKPEKLTMDNIIKSDCTSFSNLIGKITNTMTTYTSYLGNDKISDNYRKSIIRKIKLGRYYQGMEIDSSKLGKKEYLPRKWSNETKKLPYFLMYKYNYIKERYDKVNRRYHKEALKKFDIQFRDLFEEKYKEDIKIQNFIKRYYKDIPVVINNCQLNILCKYIEKYERDNFLNVYNKEYIDTSNIMTNENIKKDFNTYNKIEELYRNFMKDYNKALRKKYSLKEWKSMYNRYKNEAIDICPNSSELANYAVEICYQKHKNKHKKFAWIVADEGIIENLKLHKQNNIEIPVQVNAETFIDYLGKNFQLYTIKREVDQI